MNDLAERSGNKILLPTTKNSWTSILLFCKGGLGWPGPSSTHTQPFRENRILNLQLNSGGTVGSSLCGWFDHLQSDYFLGVISHHKSEVSVVMIWATWSTSKLGISNSSDTCKCLLGRVSWGIWIRYLGIACRLGDSAVGPITWSPPQVP